MSLLFIVIGVIVSTFIVVVVSTFGTIEFGEGVDEDNEPHDSEERVKNKVGEGAGNTDEEEERADSEFSKINKFIEEFFHSKIFVHQYK